MFNKELNKKYRLIADEERSFIRSVVIYMRAKMGHPFWHWLIPFKAVFEIIATRRMVDEYSKNVMYVKQLALDSAFHLNQDQDRSALEQDMERRIQSWLENLQLYTDSIFQKQRELARVLLEHYDRLLKSDGKSYQELVKHAYQSSTEYETFLHKISQQELKIDDEVFQIASGQVESSQKLEENMRLKQESLRQNRERDVQRVFFK